MNERSARELLDCFGAFVDPFGCCFNRRPQQAAARRYLDGLFNDSERKSMQARHGRLSEPATYQALQQFVTHSPWEAEALWTRLRAVLPAREGLVAIDDTGLPKQGRHSPGVQRQYCGAPGKIGHCQLAVSTVLVAEGVTWPLACDVYVPRVWTDDPERCAAAEIPDTVRFREKSRIALSQLRRALKASVAVTAVLPDADDGTIRVPGAVAQPHLASPRFFATPVSRSARHRSRSWVRDPASHSRGIFWSPSCATS